MTPETLPRRFYWAKAPGLLLGAFTVVAVVVRFAAVGLAERRLERAFRTYQERGEPVRVWEFAEAPVADDQNAAASLRRAAELYEASDDKTDVEDLTPSLQWTRAEVAGAADLMGRMGAVLEEIRQARDKPGINWGTKVESPAVGILLPHLNTQKDLSNLLEKAAVTAHLRGDDAAAIEYVCDMLRVSECVGNDPWLVSHLVSLSIRNQATATLRQIAPTLRVDGHGGEGGGARPDRLDALTRQLIDDPRLTGQLARALRGERMFQTDMMMVLADGKLDTSFIGIHPWACRALRPMFFDDARRGLALTSVHVDAAANARDLPGANALRPTGAPRGGRGSPVINMLTPAYNAVFNRHFASVAGSRAAAIAIAERRYELKHHDGRQARRVEDLVPEFLPTTPADPLAGGGATMPLTTGPTPPPPTTRPNR